VKDPKRTPATVSLSDLQGPQKNSLSNDIVWSHRSHPEVLRVAQKVSNFSIYFRRFPGQNLSANKPSTSTVRRSQ
jgi:hypothetical protein